MVATKGYAKKGVQYEEKVSQRLEELYGLRYIPGQWFSYLCSPRDGYKYCQCDGLLFNDERLEITLIECKYSHTSEAYFQTENLYLPVLRAWLGDSKWRINILEICKWYDPSVHFPTYVRLVERLELVRPDVFNVHILNKV